MRNCFASGCSQLYLCCALSRLQQFLCLLFLLLSCETQRKQHDKIHDRDNVSGHMSTQYRTACGDTCQQFILMGMTSCFFSLIMFVWCVMSQLLSELNEIQSFLTAQKNTLGKHFTEVRDAQAKGLVMSRMHVLGFCLWEGGLVVVKVCPGDTTSLVYLPEQSWIGILDAKVPQLLAFTVHLEKTSSAPGMLLPGEEAPHEAHSESSEQPCPVV